MHHLRKIDSLRATFALFLAVYLSAYLRDPRAYLLLDHVDLAVHEAGHLFFAPFGESVSVAGGTLLQLIVPSVFVAYFAIQKQLYSAAIVMFWVAQSLFNVSVYAADARSQALPLVGGEDVIHDWNYMLGSIGWLEHDATVGGIIRALGFIAYVVALGASLQNAVGARPLVLTSPAETPGPNR